MQSKNKPITESIPLLKDYAPKDAFNSIPELSIVQIGLFLKENDLANFSMANHKINKAIEDSNYWKNRKEINTLVHKKNMLKKSIATSELISNNECVNFGATFCGLITTIGAGVTPTLLFIFLLSNSLGFGPALGIGLGVGVPASLTVAGISLYARSKAIKNAIIVGEECNQINKTISSLRSSV